jgi:glucan phosphorylase
LNNPTRPLEASGTSGEKAIMNGVLNFSVLDGWWAEGYKPGAGWAIEEEITYKDNYFQDELDAAVLYSVIEDQIATTFYNRSSKGISSEWVTMMKENFAQIAPHFTMKRQLEDYYSQYYHKLETRTQILSENNFEKLHQLIYWKDKILSNWDDLELVNIKFDNERDKVFQVGECAHLEVKIKLGNLKPEDVKMELVIVNSSENTNQLFTKYPITHFKTEKGISYFILDLNASFSGSWKTAIRVIPTHPLLPHDMDFNLVKWI